MIDIFDETKTVVQTTSKLSQLERKDLGTICIAASAALLIIGVGFYYNHI